jgi:hypothetical protein
MTLNLSLSHRRSHPPAQLGAVLAALIHASCGDSPDKEPPEEGEAEPELPSPLLITADWVAGTLTFASMNALLEGGSRADALFSTLDLSEFQPGPLALELTPDKKKVLVTSSAGFFSVPGAATFILGEDNIPSARGRFLVVDIETQKVDKDLDTGEHPMGIAVTPDGKRAFVAHFGTGNMAVVNLGNFEIEKDIEIGIYAEEVVFDETGTVGVVTYSDDGSVRTFGVKDPERTLSEQVQLEGDSAGVAFFPGTKIAYVVQAPNPLAVIGGNATSGHTLLDLSDPSMPEVLEDVREPVLAGAYPAMVAPNRGTVIVPTALDDVFGVREYALEDGKAVLKQDIPVGEAMFLGAMGFAYDGVDTVVMAAPGDQAVVLTNLETKESRYVPWDQTAAGPADAVIR